MDADYLFLEKPLWMWLTFLAIVFVLVVFDLSVAHRKPGSLSVRQSIRMSGFYIAAALLFSLFIAKFLGAQDAKDYLTGYIVEETLSMDNIFVMSLIFGYFQIPREYQYRVLFWGIIGVVVLRGIMIGVGAELVHNFEWTLYLFGAFLVFTGVKMLVSGESQPDIENNMVLRVMRKIIPVSTQLNGNKFFIRLPDAAGKMKRYATPLLAALVVIEFVDLVFAVDSVPAIFAVTDDAYVVYTSNIFAILGLRALYFALSAMLHRFEYLKYSLSVVLIFIGGKVFAADLLGINKIPSSFSLTVTILILGAGVAYSLYKTKGSNHIES